MKNNSRFVNGALILCLVFIHSCKPLIPNKTGKVVKVKDGDSVVLLDKDNREVEIRMAHIDAPEYGQPFGRKAKQHLSDIIAGEQVEYRIYEDSDRYGRVVAELFVSDTFNVNQEMVRAGYAWHFTRYSSNRTYKKLEKEARLDQAGLWTDETAMPPWEWREL